MTISQETRRESEAEQPAPSTRELLRHAYEQIRSLRTKLDAHASAASEPIAIIGIGCRFPGGARDALKLWQLMHDGVDTVRHVPRDRFDADALYDPDPDAAGKILNRCGSFLEDVYCFDAELFGISPLEAESMDPQQRILLEVAWEALEDAGLNPLGLQGSRTGVYVGMMYQDHLTRQLREFGREKIGAYLGTGSTFSAAAGRVSYTLGLQGPSLAVDTACSSSLVSVHLACQALRGGECDLALAGGVNVILVPEPTINLSRARMMSPTGRCRTFDSAADGYTRGEGCGVVVLKRLSAALAEGDRILGLVRGSAVNQDGRSNGLTAPNGAAQRGLFRDALAAAGVAAVDVGYIECHGTGTPLGDPIEVGSILDVFGQRPAKRPLALGAVKTNFGHLECAAGICGLLKALLVLQRGEIPPSLHLRELNPNIRVNGRPVVIPTVPTPWFGDGRRLAAVNAFGFVGTNAQVILEAATGTGVADGGGRIPENGDAAVPGADRPEQKATPRNGPFVLPLSATGPDALKDLCERYAGHLEDAGASELADICFTAGTGRAHLRERAACVASTASEMVERLREASPGTGRVARGRAPANAIRPVLFFTGQGSQYAGVGRRLYESEPRFRAALDRHSDFLRDHIGERVTELLFAAPGSDRAALLGQTQFTQPALVALQLALLELWRIWGVEPAAVLGHSVGEISAAVAAGVLTPDDGLRLAAVRGRLMQALPAGGGMAAIFAPAGWARAAVADRPETLAVAGLNAPGETIISGALADLLPVLDRARAEGIQGHRIDVSHAFHSPLMRPIVERFRAALTGFEMRAPMIPLVSNLTGRFVEPGDITRPDYWRDHVLAPVRFEDSVRTLANEGLALALEIGPQPTLAALAAQTVPGFVTRPALRRGRDDMETTCSTLADLYVDGVAIDWRGVHAGAGRRRVPLPHYPFRRERHCPYPEGDSAEPSPGPPPEPSPGAARHSVCSRRLLGQPVEMAGAARNILVWEVDAEPSRRRYLREHVLLGRAICADTGQIELALEAAQAGLGVACCEIEDLELMRTLYAKDPAAQRIQVQLERRRDGGAWLRVYARAAAAEGAAAEGAANGAVDGAAEWQLHTRASVRSPRQAPSRPVARMGAVPTDAAPAAARPRVALEFSMMFFAAIEASDPTDRYGLILKAARRGDAAGFAAVWVPERHFTEMGSLYPNPSVLHAALARETSRIHLRAGSVVLPLHHPVRIAEEWAMVDNLSGGRVGVSLAPGWNPADFLLAPGKYDDRYRDLYDGVERLRALWRGEPVTVDGVSGGSTQVRIYPTPVQRELPIWITAARSPESFRNAGALGANLLTHLLDQDMSALAEKIAIYRAARAAHGHDPDAGRVTVMCHTFLAGDLETVRRLARKPFCDYLKSSKPLLRGLALSRDQTVDIDRVSDADLQAFVEFLYERFESTRALFGTPEGCLEMTQRLRAAGVDEVACLLDFGPGSEAVLSHLPHLEALRDLHTAACAREESAPEPDASDACNAPAPQVASPLPAAPAHIDLVAAREGCPTRLSPADFYEGLATRGVDLQGSLQILRELACGDGEAVGRMPGQTRRDDSNEVGPALIDGCMQTAVAAMLHRVDAGDPGGIFVPTRVGRVQLHRPAGAWPEDDIHAFARIAPASAGRLTGSVAATDADGAPLLSIHDVVAERVDAEARDDELASWGYEICWRTVEIADGELAGTSSADGWIVLADQGGVAEAWLGRRTGNPLCVRRFDEQDSGGFAWLEALDLSRCPGILCLWPLDEPLAAATEGEALLAAQERGVATLIALVQAIARSAGSRPRIWVATRGAQAVTPGDAVAGFAHASVWGVAAAIAREHPRAWGGVIDLDTGLAPASAAAGLEVLLRSSLSEDQVALRAGIRYVRRLVRARLDPVSERFHVSGKGAYVIAGGLGGLGLTVARWLVNRGARHLLLLGRSARDADDPLLKGLAVRGAAVDYRKVDIGDATAFERVLGDWHASNSPGIRGVVHAAGVFHDQPLEAIEPGHIEAGLRAKIVGAHTLDRVLGHLPLDFFLLFSSFSGLTPPAGQAVYASACAFLDGIAARRRAAGRTALSIDWGAWSAVGFAATDYGQRAHARLMEAGVKRMTPDQGVQVLERLLGGDPPARFGVFPADVATLARNDEQLARMPLLRELLGEATREAYRPSASATAFLAALKQRDIGGQRAFLVDAMRRIIAEVLKLGAERVDVEAQLTHLGLDSLVALQFKNRVAHDLGLEVSLVEALRGASVATLAERLLTELRVEALRAAEPAGKGALERTPPGAREEFAV
jgi:natural product biosynthesis luciferase-like monooxygenase protein